MNPSILNDTLGRALVQVVAQVNQRLLQCYAQYQQNHALHIETKQDNSPLTAADLMAHQLIKNALEALTPDIPLLSEESASEDLTGEQSANEQSANRQSARPAQRHAWQRFWLVDPLDGTREFINKTGEFTVNIALIEQGEVVIAIIGVPTRQMIYFHQHGQPVYRIATQGDRADWQVMVPKPVNLQEWHIAMSRRSRFPAYEQFRHLLIQHQQKFASTSAGSAYKFCLMFEGLIDVYPRYHPTSEWDTASGQGILQALGGGLYDLQGQPFHYNQRQQVLNGHFLAVRHNDYLPLALQLAHQAVQHNQSSGNSTY